MITSALKSLTEVQAALDKLRADIAAKHAERNRLYAELNAATQAPPARSDIEGELANALDTLSAAQVPQLRNNLTRWINAPSGKSDIDLGHALTQWLNNSRPHETGLTALLIPAMKSGVKSALAAMEWPEGALDAATRQGIIDKLAGPIRQVDADLAELQNQADSLGLK